MKNLLYISFLFLGVLSFGQAKIKFDTLVYNLEPVKVEETTRLKISFTNIGNEPLVITKYQTGSSNTTISVSNEPVLPNQSGYLEVKISNLFSGNFLYSFVVGINNQKDVTFIKINTIVIDDSKSERVIHGNVISIEDGLPLPGATVIVKNTNRGNSTDLDGNYSVVATPNDTLVFGFIGMKEQKIRADKDTINVQMESDGIILDVEFGPPIIPRPQPVRNLASVRPVTSKDIRNADNPKYNFKRKSKDGIFIIFVPEITHYGFNEKEADFQQKYKVRYILAENYSLGYMKEYNKLTFKHLNKKYKKTWQTEIRKDAVGLDDFLR